MEKGIVATNVCVKPQTPCVKQIPCNSYALDKVINIGTSSEINVPTTPQIMVQQTPQRLQPLNSLAPRSG